MLLHTVYTVITPPNRALNINLPLTMPLDADTVASLEVFEGSLRLVVDRKIDPAQLEVVADIWYRYRELSDGTKEPIPALRLIDDDAPENILKEDFISTLTFLLDVPITLSGSLNKNKFLPETNAEQELLERLGTDEVYSKVSAHMSMRSFNAGHVTDQTITNLLPRHVGVRLYANAMKANLAIAQFREFWRILEAAFGEKDRALVALLVQYEPAKQLRFDEAEIKGLWVLRGRASHAQSKAGIKELVHVERECAKQLPRLKNLCERVILTKKDWGSSIMETYELLPLAAFIGPDNSLVMFQSAKKLLE